jgi:hypothetical protein
VVLHRGQPVRRRARQRPHADAVDGAEAVAAGAVRRDRGLVRGAGQLPPVQSDRRAAAVGGHRDRGADVVGIPGAGSGNDPSRLDPRSRARRSPAC